MIPVEHFTRELFELLDETFEQVHGIYLDRNTSLFETLQTISAEEASIPVSATCATLAAQVKHVSFYLNVLEDVMRDKQASKVDWGEIWRTTRSVTPVEWDMIRSELRASYQRILTLTRSFDHWDGENEISGVLAVLVHTAYHLGEIRQALCVVKQANRA